MSRTFSDNPIAEMDYLKGTRMSVKKRFLRYSSSPIQIIKHLLIMFIFDVFKYWKQPLPVPINKVNDSSKVPPQVQDFD